MATKTKKETTAASKTAVSTKKAAKKPAAEKKTVDVEITVNGEKVNAKDTKKIIEVLTQINETKKYFEDQKNAALKRFSEVRSKMLDFFGF